VVGDAKISQRMMVGTDPTESIPNDYTLNVYDTGTMVVGARRVDDTLAPPYR